MLLAKEKEIQAKETQRQTTLKKASIGALLGIVLLSGLVVYMFRQRLKNQKMLAAKNEEIKGVDFKRQLSELEMKALRTQINPHFIFNCLNSINRMILSGEADDASRYLTKFSKLIRLILENAEDTTVSLKNELAMLESYIQLEALRFKGKISYKISVDATIEPESIHLPSMVLQPFVENAIWHGLMHKENDDKGMIAIVIREEEGRLLCTIEDNGVGREKAKVLREKTILKSKSMGIKITEERLRLLSKEQLKQLIRITDLKDSLNQVLGTRVDIMVPIL
jgi:sensor histidine kinase YesM